MAVTGQDVVNKATQFLGEDSSRFCRDYGVAAGTAYCCIFVWDIFRMLGISKLFMDGGKTAWVPTAQQWLHRNCDWVKMADAEPGDIVIFTWDGNGYNSGNGSISHIGFIRRKGTSSTAYTIEGNTSGGIVDNRTRASAYIRNIYRPKYGTVSGGGSSSSSSSSSGTASNSYIIGNTYILQDYMYVRKGAGTEYAIKKVSQLTADGRRNATASSGAAILKKGTEVTCLATRAIGNEIWMQIPSGWVCAKQVDTVYISTSAVSTAPTPVAPSISYDVGRDYILQDYLNVRAGAGTDYAIKKVGQLTADGRRNATSTSAGANAVLRKGTEVTCIAVKTSGSYVWMQIPSGWICAVEGSSIYIR